MTKEYRQLTYRGQVQRLRELGQSALSRFGLPPSAPLKLCSHGENTVFQTRDRRGKRYALRIHRADYQTPKMISSEMQWLAALRRDTDIVVPKPRKGRDGHFVQRVDHNGVPGTRSVVLLAWVHGRFRRLSRNANYYRMLGELAGRLHSHARVWKRPRTFSRRSWTTAVLFGEAPGFGDPMLAPRLSNRDRDLFLVAKKRMRADLRRLGKNRAVWGLIHADLHSGNVVIADDRARPIDFDDCGAGWYGYEIAVALRSVLDAGFWDRVDWFREGYEPQAALDERTIEALPCFCALRMLSMVGWLTDRSDNPRLATRLPSWIALTRKQIRIYLNR